MSLTKMVKQSKATAQAVSDGIRQAFRGKLKLTQSGEPIQRTRVAGLDGDTLRDVDQLLQFGFTSHAPADSDVIVVPLGGDTVHGDCDCLRTRRFARKTATKWRSGNLRPIGQQPCVKTRQNHRNFVRIRSTSTPAKKCRLTGPLVETSQVFTAQGQINGNGGMAIAGGSGATVSGSLKTTGDFTLAACCCMATPTQATAVAQQERRSIVN
ncbi:phage baseplate assembly protein [Kingella kingae]|uniref:phage baseplate assembly protein domain-containing protein n=1 Tax=Kingella kingae TaxID=504 RepID=UPI0004006750